MIGAFVAGLVITAGLLAAVVGCAVAWSRLQAARRVYRRTATLAAARLEDWHDWFLDGFLGVTVGTAWLSAAAVGLAWMAAGLCLISLGIRLF